MTSAERHEKRYQRRKAKRIESRLLRLDRYDNFDRCTSVSSLLKANWDTQKGVMWKGNVARYSVKSFRNARKLHNMLKAGKDTRLGYYSFQISERGKLRDIHSLHYTERVIRRSISSNAMVPVMSNGLIYDNSSSLKGKGTLFSIDRCTAMLHKYWRKNHSNDGYVLVIDFKKFFDNIQHEPLFDLLDKNFSDSRLKCVCKNFVESTGNKGLYIGPEDSQINAITFPSRIDHMIKDAWRVKAYIRYMDDSIIIMHNKDELINLRNKLYAEYEKLGIVINQKKTQIIKLSRGFTFLKTQFYLTSTGKVIRKPCRQAIVRQRRKLKSFKRFIDNGYMNVKDAECSYMSWRGGLMHKNAHRTIINTDKLYFDLFHEQPWDKKKGDKTK